MSMFTTLTARRPRRAALGVAVVAAGVAIGGLNAHQASAVLACRADPVVFLSNGVKINLSATLYNTRGSDVRGIIYTLHAPAGASVTNVVYTGGAFAGKESFVFFDDNAAHSYDSTTYVDTVSQGVSVTATAQAAGNKTGVPPVSASGYDHQNIPVHVTL